MTRWQWLALVSGAMAATPLAAQVRIERQGPGDVRVIERTVVRRGRLGVKVNLQSRDSDSIGAYVEAVTPGGPAEKAGIQSGDIITKLDGTALTGGEGDAARGRSLPGMKLIELAARLEPNDTVAVEYRRGKDRRTTKVVTEAADFAWFVGPEGPNAPRAFAFEFDDDDPMHLDGLPRQLDRMRVEMGPGGRRVWFGGPLADLELAPLNPDLGQYFGASEGVLVIDVPKDTPLGLKGGDVVLTIDGRAPSSPGHLHRILQSYEGGEAVKFEILRNKRKTTVSGKMPERGDVLKMRGPMPPRGPGAAPKIEKTDFEFFVPDPMHVPEGGVIEVRG